MCMGVWQAEGPVEQWLGQLVCHMRDQLRELLKRAKFTADYWNVEKPRHVWLFDYPAQIALTASQIIWTEEVSTRRASTSQLALKGEHESMRA